MQLNFEINKQHIKRVDNEAPVADSQNYLYAHFDFLTPEWNEISKKVNFFKNGNVTTLLLPEDNTVLIPPECLTEGHFYVSCFGGDRITNNLADVYIEQSGYAEGQPPEPFKEDFFNAVEKIALNAEKTAQSVREDADNGLFKGDKGEKGDKGDQGVQGIQGLKGDRGEKGNSIITISKSPSLHTFENSFGYKYTLPSSTVNCRVGDTLRYLTFLYPVLAIEASTIMLGNITNLKGDKGIKGDKGEPGEDYILTGADKQEIANMVHSTEIPTKTSQLENDSDYTTQSYVDNAVNSSKTKIVTDADNSVIPAFELANNTEYRFMLELDSIEFTLPDNPTDDYISSIVFKSGATATTITYPNAIKWTGDDISSDKFVPASSKTYEVLIYWNGFNYCGIVKGW